MVFVHSDMRKLLLYVTAILGVTALKAQNLDTDALLTQLQKSQADTNRVNLLRNIGVSVAHQNPTLAIHYWQQAISLSKKLRYDVGLARNFLNMATGYSFAGQYDSAMIYADSAIFFCRKTGDINRLALAFLNKADFLMNRQNFKSSLLHCDTALQFAEQTGNTDRLARIYDIIADIYAKQQQFLPAFQNLHKALGYYVKDENDIMEAQVYSDFADMYKEMRKPDSAIFFYTKAITIGENAEDTRNLSTYHADLADLLISQQNYSEAEKHIKKSLLYAAEQENNLQLSYAWFRLADLYVKQKRYQQAVAAGNKAYDYAIKEDLITHQYDAADILAQAYSGVHDFEQANKFLVISKTLNDSMAQQRYNEELATLQNSFELKEKDKTILLLNQERELQQQRLFRQRVLFIGSLALSLLAILGIFMAISRYRLRNRVKEMELRNQIAADLHDEVGSSLSSIRLLSQIAVQKNQDNSSSAILNRLGNHAKETIDKMGDIVWMISPSEKESSGLIERMKNFLHEISNDADIRTNINLDALEQVSLNMQQRKNCYLIFKEAVNNVVKYAGATTLHVDAGTVNSSLQMDIADDGKGFDTTAAAKGNGLRNMRQRASDLGGTLALRSSPGAGTSIRLIFPV